MAKRERKPPKKPVRMTDLWVQNYKTPGLSPSDTESGIRLHVGASGRKSWIHFYRHPISRKLVKRTLPFMSLAQVRKRVADDKFLLSQGTDPVEEQKAQRQAAINKSEGTLNALAETYLGLCAKKLRSYDLYKRVLQKQVLSRLGEKQVHELRKSDVTAVLDRIESESGPRAADLGGAILRAMLNWHERRSDTFRSPLGRMGMRVDADERVRSRRLDDDEIKRFWAATGDDRVGLFGSVLRLLLLTGGRKSECAEMKHSELATERCKNERGQWVDIVVWKLPASRSKNKDQVIRPLSRNALEIIDSAPRIGDSDYVFSLKGTKPLAMSF